jgi:SAM-dependent methyltransferase
MKSCTICQNNTDNKVHIVKETMFGTRDTFTYLECSKCGCIQLQDIPKDMSKYYPQNYYSFKKHGWLKTFLRHQWSAYAYGKFNPVGWLLSKLFFENSAVTAVCRTGVSKTARILDVGCGNGHLICDLWHLGFKNVVGVDPYIEHDLMYLSGPVVLKKELSELSESKFDLIMLHHSYEHMDQPEKVMQHLAQLIKPGGQVLIRIPKADSFSWRQYGINWINLDAPRHFFLHTRKSIEILANRVGLTVNKVIDDSTEAQFWQSEQNAKDVAGNEPGAFGVNHFKTFLVWRKNKEYKVKARQLNITGQGDMGCFYLTKVKL